MAKTSLSPHPILLHIVFFSLIPSYIAIEYPVFNGYQVQDLTSLSSAGFNLEAAEWTSVSLVGTANTTTFCGLIFLGGYNILSSRGSFERSYTSLPAHNVVYFSLGIAVIGNWQTSDSVNLLFDQNSESSISYQIASNHNNNNNGNHCGSTNGLSVVETAITGTVPHQADTITLQVLSSINQAPTAATFGIRGLSLIFANTTGTVSNSSCIYTSSSDSANNECQCGVSSYFNSSLNQCKSCATGCRGCFGPLVTQCYACAFGYSFTGTECIPCDNSCQTCSGPNPDQCVTCKSNYWLQWNNTCTSTCNSSSQQIIGNLQVCNFPCNSSEYLLYDNTICVSSCSSPLVNSTSGGYNMCNKPCASGEYYYTWNSTCGSQCTSPFVNGTESGVAMCYLPTSTTPPVISPLPSLPPILCNNNEYLYPNNSCLSTCPYPFKTNTTNSVLLCQYPCNFTAGEFIGWNGSCLSSCDSPLIQRTDDNLFYCDLVSAAEASQVEKLTSAMATTGTITSAGVIAMSVVSSASPSAFTLTSLVKMLQYIRYIKINYPPKLKYLLITQKNSPISLNFAPNLPQGFINQFDEYSLPENFEQYQLQSSFFVNYSDTLTTLAIILAIIILASIFSVLTSKYKKINVIFKKIKNVTKWDFFLLILCSNYDGIAFFSSLELRTLHLNSLAAVFTFLMCLLVNFVAFFILVKLFYAIMNIRKEKYKINPTSTATRDEKWGSLEILFRNFKDQHFSQQAYMFLFLIRLYLFDIIIGVLFEYPLIQAILLVIMSVSMVIYMIIRRPPKEIYNCIEFVINESILLFVNINVLIMAIHDMSGEPSTNLRVTCGNFIIFANMIFNITALIFKAQEVMWGLIRGYKIIKNRKGKSIWMKLALIFIEQDGLEVEDKDKNEEKKSSSLDNRRKKPNLELKISPSDCQSDHENPPNYDQLISSDSPQKEVPLRFYNSERNGLYSFSDNQHLNLLNIKRPSTLLLSPRQISFNKDEKSDLSSFSEHKTNILSPVTPLTIGNSFLESAKDDQNLLSEPPSTLRKRIRPSRIGGLLEGETSRRSIGVEQGTFGESVEGLKEEKTSCLDESDIKGSRTPRKNLLFRTTVCKAFSDTKSDGENFKE